jgi:hypothetical protein
MSPARWILPFVNLSLTFIARKLAATSRIAVEPAATSPGARNKHCIRLKNADKPVEIAGAERLLKYSL